MAFGRNSGKPVREITKEEAGKRNYFEMVGRHLMDLIKANLLFCVLNLPLFFAFLFFLSPYILNYETAFLSILRDPGVPLPIQPFIPFMLMGPSLCGLTYLLRNWARQKHAFLASDFFEHMKKNFKQGLFVSIIMTLLFYVFFSAALFYLKSGMDKTVVLIISVLVGIVLCGIHAFIYPILITFDLKLRDCFRNAWLLTLARLPQLVFYLVIVLIIHGMILFWFAPMWWVLLMMLFLIAWTGFTLNYFTWNVIEKNMMSQIKTEKEQEDSID